MDNVGAEVVYHRSGYQEFTNKYILERLKHTSVEKEFPYTAAFQGAFRTSRTSDDIACTEGLILWST